MAEHVQVVRQDVSHGPDDVHEDGFIADDQDLISPDQLAQAEERPRRSISEVDMRRDGGVAR